MIEGNAKMEGRDEAVVAAAPPSASMEDAPLPKANRTGKAPAFQFYPKDFLSDSNVMAMSLTEVGAYWKLVSICWLEETLPANTKALSRILGIASSHMLRLLPAILPCFVERDGRLIHPRLEKERLNQRKYRDKQSENGKKGGRPEKAVGSSGLTQTKANESSSSSSSSSSPISNLHTATTSKKKNVSPEPLRDSTPTELVFSTVGAPKTWDLTEGQVARWRVLYPSLDVMSECRRAKAWIEANPDKRKTAKGMSSFLVHWFNRTVDRPRALAATGTDGRGRTGAPPADKYAAFSGDGE